jgi:Xaa-Pro aminopeptidase
MNTIEQRLSAIRELMAEANYDALVIPRADEYLGEYIPAHNERLRWICEFTGSAGMVIVLRDKAAIFVDGRYTVQVRREVSGELFEYHHLVEEPHARWLAEELSAGARVACDPRMHSLLWYRDTGKTLSGAELELIADSDNLVDRCWRDRPAPCVRPSSPVNRAAASVSASPGQWQSRAVMPP